MEVIGNLKIRVGMIHRRKVRARIAFQGLHHQEFKGFLDSWFVIKGDADEVWRFYEWAARESGYRISDGCRAMRQQELFIARNMM
jgi:hypothetical protein